MIFTIVSAGVVSPHPQCLVMLLRLDLRRSPRHLSHVVLELSCCCTPIFGRSGRLLLRRLLLQSLLFLDAEVYGAKFEGRMGYRNDNTRSVAVGDEPESMCLSSININGFGIAGSECSGVARPPDQILCLARFCNDMSIFVLASVLVAVHLGACHASCCGIQAFC